jgi:hypothetical protein
MTTQAPKIPCLTRSELLQLTFAANPKPVRKEDIDKARSLNFCGK